MKARRAHRWIFVNQQGEDTELSLTLSSDLQDDRVLGEPQIMVQRAC